MQKKCGAAYPSLSLELSSLYQFHRGQKIKNNKISAYAVLASSSSFHTLHFIVPCLLQTGGRGAVELQLYHSIDFWFAKNILSDRLTVSLQAKDIFHGMKFKEKEFIDLSFYANRRLSILEFLSNIIYKLKHKKSDIQGNNFFNTDIKRTIECLEYIDRVILCNAG